MRHLSTKMSFLALSLALVMPAFANSNADTVFVSSRLGQPLKATVLLPQSASGLKLAPAEAYQAKGLPLPQLEGLSFDFAKTEGGRPFLRISSATGYESPAQTLLIEQTTGSEASLLEYAIFVDPTEPGQASTANQKQMTATPQKPPAVKRKPISKQTFNARAASVNQRLAALEKGQKELFKRFEETDRKLNLVLDKIQSDKPTNIVSEASPTVKAPPASKPAAVAPAASTPTTVQSTTPAESMDKSGKSEVTGAVSVSVSDTAAPKPVSEAASPSVAASAVAPAEKPAGVLPTPTENKPKKALVKFNEPPPPEPTLFETIVNEPLYMGGGLAALLALILTPLGIRRFRRQRGSPMTSYTMQP